MSMATQKMQGVAHSAAVLGGWQGRLLRGAELHWTSAVPEAIVACIRPRVLRVQVDSLHMSSN